LRKLPRKTSKFWLAGKRLSPVGYIPPGLLVPGRDENRAACELARSASLNKQETAGFRSCSYREYFGPPPAEAFCGGFGVNTACRP